MHFQKILTLGLAFTTALAFAACGREAQTDNVSIETSNIPLESGSWKIGGIGENATDMTARSLAVQFGAQIAVDEINAAGGINGAMVEFSFLEDESRFLLVPSGSSVDIIAAPFDMLLASLADANRGEECAQYIGENSMAGKAAVIYDSSDAYSKSIYKQFAEKAGNYSFETVAAEAFSTESNGDFTAQLERVRSAGAELLFLPVNSEEVARILTQADEMGYKPVILGCDSMAGILELDNFDTSLAEGVVLPMSFAASAEDEATANFVMKYKQMYGAEPNQSAAAAYDSVYIIKAVLEEADAAPDMSMDDISEMFKEVITAVIFDGLTGTGMTWNADGEVDNTAKFMVIRDGAYVVCE